MTERARIFIRIADHALEVEGSESFVERYSDRIDLLINRLLEQPGEGPQATPVKQLQEPNVDDLGPFGLYLQNLSNNVTDVERVLAAGFWIEKKSNDDCFTTSEASKLLLEQGHKVGNPSQCVKQSLVSKNLFVIQKGRYRVSKAGRDRLRLLMGDIIPI